MLRDDLRARMLARTLLLSSLLLSGAAAAADAPRRIVLIGGGPTSEGIGRHDYPNGVAVLERLLGSSPDLQGIRIETHPDGWPRDAAFEGASTLVWYFEGLDKHPLVDPQRNARFEALMRSGVGLVTLHQASTVPVPQAPFELERWLGAARHGMFDRATELARVRPATRRHPVARGVAPATYLDEFYPTLRWSPGARGLTPILKARVHVEFREGKDLVIDKPTDATVAWAWERDDGGRAFGFTGAHYLVALDEPSVRTMLLNAIAWTAHLDVPAGGIRSLHPDAAAQALRVRPQARVRGE